MMRAIRTSALHSSVRDCGRAAWMALLFLAMVRPVALLAQPVTITTVAGDLRGGSLDGDIASSLFDFPAGVAVAPSGIVYVGAGFTIRRIDTQGRVATIAGKYGETGSADGVGGAARFSGITDMVVDPQGNVFIADNGNHTIRRMTPQGEVTTYAGSPGQRGAVDGPAREARFGFPHGLAFDGEGNLFVSETGSFTIRKITPQGIVSTFAGMAGTSGGIDGTGAAARFRRPQGLAIDPASNLYVADRSSRAIRKITRDRVVTTLAGSTAFGNQDGVGAQASFEQPAYLAYAADGNLYVVDNQSHLIRRVTLGGAVTTVAGLADIQGFADGTGSAARFRFARQIAVEPSGTMLVVDNNNWAIRRVTTSGVVTTFAGLGRNQADGPAASARFPAPYGIATDSLGNSYVADINTNTIRKITPQGEVSTLAGSPDTVGNVDGVGSAARFNQPYALAADAVQNVYVADTLNNTIRKITPAGLVTTLAGSGECGGSDGFGNAASFCVPSAIAVDSGGTLYVGDGFQSIRRITSSGLVSTLVANSQDLVFPTGIVVEPSGDLVIADQSSSLILKVSPVGQVTTLAGMRSSFGYADGTGSAARFNQPWGIVREATGNYLVSDGGNNVIRRVTPAGVVTTVAGQAGFRGSLDGIGSAARFWYPSGMSFDTTTGRALVVDDGNGTIRAATTGSVTLYSATIDSTSGSTGVIRQLDTTPSGASFWTWSIAQRPVGSRATLSSTNTKNPTFTPDVPGLYTFRLAASTSSGFNASEISLSVTGDPLVSRATRVVPIVLDVTTTIAHFVSELTLTNAGATPVSVQMTYTASLGNRKEGSGSLAVSERPTLAPGRQLQIANALDYLRSHGLAIPASSTEPQQGGTLVVTFESTSSGSLLSPRLLGATARTATLTAAPQPVGRAGLAYSGLLVDDSTSTSSSGTRLSIFGLRSSSTDRSNLAIFSTSNEPVTVRVTVFSGTGNGQSVVYEPTPEEIPPYGFVQYNSNRLLDATGISNGWAVVERTSTGGSFSAYGVINDNATSDGSFVLPVGDASTASGLTVPVLVETAAFKSELVLTNRSSSSVTFTCQYRESLSPAGGVGGTFTITLAANEQRIIPEAVDFIRRQTGVALGAKGAASYSGSLRVSFAGASAANVFAGARTAAQSTSSAGGQFGLFTPGIFNGSEASDAAYLYGLRADSENRTNVAIVNTGGAGAGSITLRIQAYDGATGNARGDALDVSLGEGEWSQPANYFRNTGVANGFVTVTRVDGSAPWIAYAVVNDGGSPGQRTGDGAYVPMVK